MSARGNTDSLAEPDTVAFSLTAGASCAGEGGPATIGPEAEFRGDFDLRESGAVDTVVGAGVGAFAGTDVGAEVVVAD